ncbi:MAG: phosphoglycolate phosphatase [Oceanicoccus sp.]|jgi:phosphoglycolate phosphatase
MLVIFDWDGTLMDSTDKIAQCLLAAINQLNLAERSVEQAKSIIGLGLPEACLSLYPDIGAPMMAKLQQAYSEHFIRADKIPCSFYPRVEEVMAELKGQGHQLAVATGKSRRGLNRVMGSLALQDFFDGSRCADETASKPDPLMINELLVELGYGANQAVMVGDTSFDLEMAANAGVASIGVSYGAHPVERLLAHNPKLMVDHFEHILDWSGFA